MKIAKIVSYTDKFMKLAQNTSLDERINDAKSLLKEMINSINDKSYYRATNIFLTLNEDVSRDILLNLVQPNVDDDKFIAFENELASIERSV